MSVYSSGAQTFFPWRWTNKWWPKTWLERSQGPYKYPELTRLHAAMQTQTAVTSLAASSPVTIFIYQGLFMAGQLSASSVR